MPAFQMSLELTNRFPTREIARTGFEAVINYARDLRKSGSDLLVEHDLSTIFGRGKIDGRLATRFKDEILQNVAIKPLYPDSSINLISGPGPTVAHALKSSPDQGHLSTVIQLSLLAWFHDRDSLASSLSECIGKRHAMEYPGSNPDPGIERITGTLQACSSQTSAFPWDQYSIAIARRLRSALAGVEDSTLANGFLLQLSPNTFFASMDLLYMIQSLPEDRKMLVEDPTGVIFLIIWAHYVLSLNVIIENFPTGDVVFGDATTPQVIIKWKSNMRVAGIHDPMVYLLDGDMKIIFTVENKNMELATITRAERLCLASYGTHFLRRAFNCLVSIEDENPIYQESVHYIVAITIHVSKRLVRFSRGNTDIDSADLKDGNRLRIDRWRLITASKIIFQDIDVSMKLVDSYLDSMLDHCSLEDLPQPRTLQRYLSNFTDDDKLIALSALRLRSLVALVLAFSNVQQLQQCHSLPLISNLTALGMLSFVKRIWSTAGLIAVTEGDFFDIANQLLTGSLNFRGLEAEIQEYPVFLVSDFGWSLTFDVVGDKDPVDVNPALLHIHAGVPTNATTGERKYRIGDFIYDRWGTAGKQFNCIVFDRGVESFVPRCITHVVRRKEYYNTSKEAFLLSIRLSLEEPINNSVEPQHFELSTCFRMMQRALWHASVAAPCDHRPTSLKTAKLGLGVATVNALRYEPDGFEDEEPELPERICVCLVKGDARMRWLALVDAVDGFSGRVMLRGNDCCENCAIDAAAALPGDWVVVI